MAILARTALILAAFLPVIAFADSGDVARRLGYMLGSEAVCGFHFRRVAVEEFIAENVAADDMDFIVVFDLVVADVEDDSRSLGASELVARCAQVRRVAETLGFMSAR